MKNLLKKVLAVLLAVAMVLAAVPAVEFATARNVHADTIFDSFNPTLEFYNVKANSYAPYTSGAAHYIKWSISNSSNSLDNDQEPNYAKGEIQFLNNPYVWYKTWNYYNSQETYNSFYVDLAGAIDSQTSAWAQNNRPRTEEKAGNSITEFIGQDLIFFITRSFKRKNRLPAGAV